MGEWRKRREAGTSRREDIRLERGDWRGAVCLTKNPNRKTEIGLEKGAWSMRLESLIDTGGIRNETTDKG